MDLQYLCFFVTSGYFLIAREESIKKNVSRIIKVLAVVLIWNVIYWLLYSIKGIVVSQRIDIIRLPISILKGFTQQGIFWYFQFLAALIIVYALLPLIGCLLQENLKRRIWILWSLFFIVGLVLQFMSEFVYKQSLQRFVVQPFRIWTWLQYFLWGCITSL